MKPSMVGPARPAHGAEADQDPGMEGPEGVSAILAAVIDNRAGEVGLAVLDADGGALLLSQHVETTRTFARTM